MVKSDVMETLPNGSSYEAVGTINTGENKVTGFEISLTGNITNRLSTYLGLTTMESEVTESNNPDNIGKPLSNFAEDSAFAQLRYQMSPQLAFGGSATYSSEQYPGQPDSAAGETYKVPSYTVFDVFASYEFSKDLAVRLNIGNVTDKDYYLAAYRSGAFAYKGDAQNAQLSVTYEF